VKHGFKLQKDLGWRNDECWHVPDATGMGEGLMHLFHEAKKQVHEFKFNASASEPDYKDKITEGWFNLRRLTKQRIIHVPNDQEMIRQLTTRQYLLTKDGKFVVESKDDYLKRGSEFSPDRADAMVLAFYDRMMSRARTTSRAVDGGASRSLSRDLGIVR
jgi:hypothetical protein